MDMFTSELNDFNKQFVPQKQYKLINGKFGKVSVYKHEPTQKEFVVKYIKTKCFNPIEPYVHYLMKDNDVFVKLFYSFNWLRGHLLIMDFIQEGDLFDLLKQQTLTECEVKNIIGQLVEGLNCLHQHKIIHNDIKLENILYNNRKQVKLCDYGLCQHVGVKSVYDGTLDYFSPEKIEEKPYDIHFDWWAVGIVMYELLTEQSHPFKIDKDEDLTLEKLRKRQQQRYIEYDPVYRISIKTQNFINNLLKYSIAFRITNYIIIKSNLKHIM
ncbi:Protein kinase-1 [Trabala vishnou gigantina nucleopolyhedrovirus]|uniref:Protein kinase-1 n=1 Tax=Trabala vishnou gigantina nucleopolyhedrovirus TaxID=2863583 RepID=UPI00248202D7|nr:Protein kinase-1 [Trabala vishnou gigantina nucleopolyhedrovirus]QYC92717.1 Protein kinase-1 [Trabala vishnou gigantina nucleopolyhedrovirus]